ncbi:MAG: hypothetical protein HQK76_03035 [Desulfobacterales bacterium]|nr:hypothetical protein [Desulfobacterales bacterium]
MDKIKDALKVLDEIAKENKEQLIKTMDGKYEYLKCAIIDENGFKDSLTLAAHKIADFVTSVKTSSNEKAKEIVVAFNQSVHQNPWHYIGGVAVGSFLLSFVLNRKKAV